jgi:uncharacterized protein (DUF2062 family)
MKKRIRDYIKRFFLIDDSPHKVAGGAALGIFLGIVPGEGVLATLFLSSLFRLNRLAALAGVGAVNMWTTVLVFPLAAMVGRWIFGVSGDTLKQNFEKTTDAGFRYFFGKAIFFDLTLPLMVGFLIVAGTISLAFYFGLLYFLVRKKRLQKDAHLLRKENSDN